MRGLLIGFVRAVDAFNTAFGRLACWLILGSVVLSAATALLRYGFNTGFIWMQELYVACYALTFLLVAAYAYLRDDHVRVDIFFAGMSERGKATVEIVGILVFLFPWLIVVAAAGVPFILASWRVLEASSESGGLRGIFLLKSVIWVFCGSLALQGLSQLIKNAFVLAGDDAFHVKHHLSTDVVKEEIATHQGEPSST